MKKEIKIAPSILSANFEKLGSEVQDIDEAGADYIHIDIMDGAFVPNITFGADVVKSLRHCTKKIFDVHLMLRSPERYIEQFVAAGADIITIHYESTIHLDRIIRLVKSYGVKVGVSLVPSTHENTLYYVLEDIDMVLVMTVNPGFSGQSFLPSQLPKIGSLYQIINNHQLNVDIEVDGGINIDNVNHVVKEGANIIVAGSSIFNGKGFKEYKQNIADLRIKSLE